jgi:dolichyl-phosphate beta-glucosyltransferase
MVIEVVIPAYNESRRIASTLERCFAYTPPAGHALRVTVCDDGSTDDTCAVVEGMTARFPDLRLLKVGSNKGKGAAVRLGMTHALPDSGLLLLSDADLASPIEEVERLLPHMDHAAVAIGSRALDRSLIQVHQPLHREFMGIVYNRLVQALLLPGLYDTQCGFKLFRAAVAKEIFSASIVDGFSYDVEVLRLATARGYIVEEVPVHWFHVEDSKVRLLSAPAAMFGEVAAIARRLGRGPRACRCGAGGGWPARRIPY